ncbi:MAG: hypothetical protein Q9227_007231 [Pyrenula ochraceoflavens]
MDAPDFSLLKPPPITKKLLTSRASLFSAAISLRFVLLIYGLYQDAHSALKYTDIDYYVFTDAARYVAYGRSPYFRDTYRYTPLLAWTLIPTTWGGWWFSFGKALFASADIVAGWMILELLRRRGIAETSAMKYSCAWLLNPMVANISTRGSSEGLLCMLVMGMLWAKEYGRIALAGTLLGLSVHFKIYPFIYGASIIWSLETKAPTRPGAGIIERISNFLNEDRLIFLLTSLGTFSALNLAMYSMYQLPFIEHTYLYHLIRTDHRHNFSPYNILLYQSSANNSHGIESLAFFPQLFLSVIAIPFALAKKDLASTLLAQTIAFVTFNKVCTSQYFLWYLVFLPLYLPTSYMVKQPSKGIAALLAWIAGQAVWLQQGYQLEFLGQSTFVPGLWLSSLVFFGVNVVILGSIILDIAPASKRTNGASTLKTETAEKDEDEEGVEEISREKPIEQVVKEQMRLNRAQEQNLKAYMSDISDLMPGVE